MRKHYLKLNDIRTELSYLAGPNSTVFKNCHYFDGTLNWHGVDLVLMMDDITLWDYWVNMYGNRRIGFTTDQFPTTEGDSEAMSIALQVNRILDDFFVANKEKYCGMVKALSINYDPLASYDMTEISGGTTETADIHNTPAHTETEIQSSTYESESYRNAQKTLQGPQAIQGVGDSYSNTGYADSNKTLTWTNGDQTGDFTTPSGNTTTVAKSHKWGTTDRPAQEFIEKEFEVRRQNIIKEFFEDLNSHVFLATWD